MREKAMRIKVKLYEDWKRRGRLTKRGLEELDSLKRILALLGGQKRIDQRARELGGPKRSK